MRDVSLPISCREDQLHAAVAATRLADELGLSPRLSVGLRAAVATIAGVLIGSEGRCELRLLVVEEDERGVIVALRGYQPGTGEADLEMVMGEVAPALFAATGMTAAITCEGISFLLPLPGKGEKGGSEERALPSLGEQSLDARHELETLLLLDENRCLEEDVARLERELDDTNEGVLALYQELDDRAEASLRAYEVQSCFVSNLTHEFRTPLAAITSLARILLEGYDGDLNEEQRHQVSLVLQSAEDLNGLVDDLLEWAKAKLGVLVVQPSEFPLRELFGSTRGVMRPLLRSNAVQLIFEDPSPEMPVLRTDKNKVAQILRNLISNAIKFTPRGEIRVAAGLSEDRESVLLSVTDQGVGIEPENLERVFEEFVQVCGPQQINVKGTGLGLSLSRRLAEALGGSLTVTSSPGKGSTFVAAIPVEYRPKNDEAAARAASLGHGGAVA